jgi:phage shock protein E
MATPIDRHELERLVAGGAQLVEALPDAEYQHAHLPGAINLPLRRLDASTAEVLDRARPVVVYCWDSL